MPTYGAWGTTGWRSLRLTAPPRRELVLPGPTRRETALARAYARLLGRCERGGLTPWQAARLATIERALQGGRR